MSLKIDTGTLVAERTNASVTGVDGFVGRVTEYNDTTPSELVIYPSPQRRLLVVEPQTIVVITAYNLVTQFSFRKVLRSNGIPVMGTANCCPSAVVGHTVKLHTAPLPSWKLTPDCPIFIIQTPGVYELDIGDNLDIDAVVTAMSYSQQPTTNCCTCGGG